MVFFTVLAFVIHNSSSAQINNQVVAASSASAASTTQVNPLDQLSSSQIAVQVARMTGIYEATSVANLADSQTATTNIVPSDNQVISKPTVIATAVKSRQDIVKYVTQPGDSVSALAIKYGVNSNSIMWSNSLTGNNLSPGITLYIPPINGIVYSVKAGDTAATLSQKYNTDSNQITSFNDAEVSGFSTGEQIVIPGATAPVNAVVANSYGGSYNSGTESSSSFSFGYGPVYGSNGYDFGYCTWYVAQKRAAAGHPVPANLGNASSWYALAQAAGMPTGLTPQPGAVIWFGYGANHVGYVESVAANGDVTISEMNRDGWDVADTRVIPAGQAASYKYIY